MTKEEFLKQLKAIYKAYSKRRANDKIGGEFLENVKELALSYNRQLLYPVFKRWVNDEQAIDIIRRQPTLSDIMHTVYYIDHLSGLYRYDLNGDGTATLSDSNLYDVIEDIFEALDEPDPKWYLKD